MYLPALFIKLLLFFYFMSKYLSFYIYCITPNMLTASKHCIQTCNTWVCLPSWLHNTTFEADDSTLNSPVTTVTTPHTLPCCQGILACCDSPLLPPHTQEDTALWWSSQYTDTCICFNDVWHAPVLYWGKCCLCLPLMLITWINY